MAKKCTNTEMEQRINTVYKMLLRSVGHKEILQYSASKWGLKKRQTDEIIHRANKCLYAKSEATREQQLEKRKKQYEDLLDECRREKDRNTARNVMADLSKLEGHDRIKVEDDKKRTFTLKYTLEEDE
jgi:beta-lactamase class A